MVRLEAMCCLVAVRQAGGIGSLIIRGGKGVMSGGRKEGEGREVSRLGDCMICWKGRSEVGKRAVMGQ